MKLCYLDETGYTGPNLLDIQQPNYILSGLIIDSTRWRIVNNEIREIQDKAKSLFKPDVIESIQSSNSCCREWTKKILGKKYEWSELNSDNRKKLFHGIEAYFTKGFEFHAKDLFPGNGSCKGISYVHRVSIINELINVVKDNSLEIIFILIRKRSLKNRYTTPEPYEMLAFMYFVELFDDYLNELSTEKTGLMISDEVNYYKKLKAELVVYQQESTYYQQGRQIRNIIDTIHFADSKESLCIQLSDIIAYTISRKIRDDRRWKPQFENFSSLIKNSRSFP